MPTVGLMSNDVPTANIVIDDSSVKATNVRRTAD